MSLLSEQLREIRAQAVRCPVYSRGLAVAYTVHLPAAALEVLEAAAMLIEDAGCRAVDGPPVDPAAKAIPEAGSDTKTAQTGQNQGAE